MTSPGQHSFTVNNSEVLLDTPIIAVRRDVLNMPGGNVANREIVEHFGAVAIVAFDGTNIAMIKQYRHSVQQRLWELPAGLLDIAEEEPLVCAQRELVEEAGLEAATWGVLTDLVSSPGFCEEAVRIYLAQDVHEVPRPKAEGEEADMQFSWVTLEDAQDMVMRGEVVNSIAIAGIMIAAELITTGCPARSVDEPFRLRPASLPRRRKIAGRHADMKQL